MEDTGGSGGEDAVGDKGLVIDGVSVMVSEGQVSVACQNLSTIPPAIIQKFSATCTSLDLSDNSLTYGTFPLRVGCFVLCAWGGRVWDYLSLRLQHYLVFLGSYLCVVLPSALCCSVFMYTAVQLSRSAAEPTPAISPECAYRTYNTKPGSAHPQALSVQFATGI
jgi:hypothetical protein